MKTIFGIPISSEFMTLAEVVYPNDQDLPFQNYGQLAIEIATLSLEMRHNAAVIGAMRWESSQEAYINAKSTYDIRVL